MLADKRRPAVVLQSHKLSDPRVRTFLVVPLTSRLHLAELAGTARLSRRVTGLAKDSVANVYDVQKVLRVGLVERVGAIPAGDLAALADSLRLVLDL